MAEIGAETRGDDFKEISGIGPAIERRLHNAGILTYAQLAAMTPAGLAEQLKEFRGMSAERIEQQAWIERAHELAPERVVAHERSVDVPGNGQHYATFSIELLLDDKNDVRRTRLVYIQGREESTWAGWDRQRLLRFVEENAGLMAPVQAEETVEAVVLAEVAIEPPSAEVEDAGDLVAGLAALPATETSRHEERAAQAARAAATRRRTPGVEEQRALRREPVDLRIMKFLQGAGGESARRGDRRPTRQPQISTGNLSVTPSGEEAPRRMWRQGDPFSARLALDARDLPAADSPAEYRAALIARAAGSTQVETVGEAWGTLAPGETEIALDGRIMAPGLYRLEAELTFGGAGERHVTRIVRGDFVRVW